jgi:hypothetical protein
MSDKSIGDAFDSAMKYGRSKEYDEKDFCVRKYVLDNNLIDANVHNISLASTNINVTNVDCDKLIKEMIATDEEKTKQDFEGAIRECIVEKERETENSRINMMLNVLSKLDINEKEKLVEREKYIKYILDLNQKKSI